MVGAGATFGIHTRDGAELIGGGLRTFADDLCHPCYPDGRVREELADAIEITGIVSHVAREDQSFDIASSISHVGASVSVCSIGQWKLSPALA